MKKNIELKQTDITYIIIKEMIIFAKKWTRCNIQYICDSLERSGWDNSIIVWGDRGNRIYWEMNETDSSALK